MESFTTIGNMYAKSTLDKVAYSALPDAPVQPYIEPQPSAAPPDGRDPPPDQPAGPSSGDRRAGTELRPPVLTTPLS